MCFSRLFYPEMSHETDDNDVLSWLERRKKKNKNRYDMKYIHEHVTCFNETQSKASKSASLITDKDSVSFQSRYL